MKATVRKQSLKSLSIIKLISFSALSFSLLAGAASSFANGTAAMNFYGDYTTGNTGPQDPSKPVSMRSYFTTSVEETPDGCKLIVDIWHGKLMSPVSIWLQAAVNDGKGNFEAIPFIQLDDKVADNKTNFHSRREYRLTYAQLNAAFGKLLPAGAAHLKIGPGTPLFVYANFDAYSHQWGGVGRGGIFFMPEGTSSGSSSLDGVAARRPTEFEVAYPVTSTMTMKYNDPKTGAGLKPGGEIGSHVEAEGKFQIPLEDTAKVKKRLFELAQNPAEAAKVLGPEWSLHANMRYMLKDKAGKYILDSQGLPTPDPMVDTYYDNDNYDAARRDVNIRYRMTEQNGVGKWGLKPGMGKDLGNGIVRRVEYALDATDNKPETIRAFSDSMDPLNPFRAIREAIPGATPSTFLKPSVKVTDTRFKFELKHKNGLTIEVSLDQVRADSLRANMPSAEYTQMELDIGHASTSSGKTAGVTGGFTGLSGSITPMQTAFLKKLGAGAILDGRPVMHGIADLDDAAPVQVKNEADLGLATVAIEALRDDVIGKNWLPGAQKGSLAATALGIIAEKDSSASVKKTLAAEKAAKANGATFTLMRTQGAKVGGQCGQAFGN